MERALRAADDVDALQEMVDADTGSGASALLEAMKEIVKEVEVDGEGTMGVKDVVDVVCKALERVEGCAANEMEIFACISCCGMSLRVLDGLSGEFQVVSRAKELSDSISGLPSAFPALGMVNSRMALAGELRSRLGGDDWVKGAEIARLFRSEDVRSVHEQVVGALEGCTSEVGCVEWAILALRGAGEPVGKGASREMESVWRGSVDALLGVIGKIGRGLEAVLEEEDDVGEGPSGCGDVTVALVGRGGKEEEEDVVGGVQRERVGIGFAKVVGVVDRLMESVNKGVQEWDRLYFLAVGEIVEEEEEKKVGELQKVVEEVERLRERVEEKIVKGWVSMIQTLGVDVLGTSQWSDHRPFLGGAKPAYGVSIMHGMLRGISRDLSKHTSPTSKHTILSKILLHIVTAAEAHFNSVRPSRARTPQLRADVTAFVTSILVHLGGISTKPATDTLREGISTPSTTTKHTLREGISTPTSSTTQVNIKAIEASLARILLATACMAGPALAAIESLSHDHPDAHALLYDVALPNLGAILDPDQISDDPRREFAFAGIIFGPRASFKFLSYAAPRSTSLDFEEPPGTMPWAKILLSKGPVPILTRPAKSDLLARRHEVGNDEYPPLDDDQILDKNDLEHHMQ